MNRLRQHGTSLLEVLVTLVILSIGLLGIAALQAKTQVGSVESYQRAQAIILLGDMVNRIGGNPNNADSYVSNSIGTGDGRSDDCSAASAGANLDLCEWSKALRGAAELASDNSTKLGAMVGGRGCVEKIQDANTATGVCRPAIYRVTVAWQGLHQTTAPSLTCGSGQYGSETYRRVAVQQVTVGLPSCS
jgi:type IV pilus assembly protein PilV